MLQVLNILSLIKILLVNHYLLLSNLQLSYLNIARRLIDVGTWRKPLKLITFMCWRIICFMDYF